jgi:hypothetical protein
MYYNELLLRKIVGQTGEHAIVWQQRGDIGIDRPTFTRRKLKFGSKDSSAVRIAELKAVRRLPAVRAGQGCAYAPFEALS